MIRRAYELADADPGFAAVPATDDCGVVLRYLPDVPVGAVTGSERNLKITYAADLAVAQALLDYRDAGRLSQHGCAGSSAAGRVRRGQTLGNQAARTGQEAGSPAHVHRRQRDRQPGSGPRRQLPGGAGSDSQ